MSRRFQIEPQGLHGELQPTEMQLNYLPIWRVQNVESEFAMKRGVCV